MGRKANGKGGGVILYVRQEMWEDCKRIWMRCFGDGEEYTSFLFRELLRPDRVMVYADREGNPQAMLCIQPFDLVSHGDAVCRGAYVFGVATDPAHQGKGLSTSLMEGMHKLLKREKYALSVLVPASGTLFGFYGKRGYEAAFSVRKIPMQAGDIPSPRQDCILIPSALPRLAELRNKFYGHRNMFVRWDEDYLQYLAGECRLLGGEMLQIAGGGQEGFAICYQMENRVVVKELAVYPEGFDDAMAALHARYRAAEYLVYLPADFPGEGTPLPFAMAKWYDNRKQADILAAGGAAPYIAHVLD